MIFCTLGTHFALFRENISFHGTFNTQESAFCQKKKEIKIKNRITPQNCELVGLTLTNHSTSWTHGTFSLANCPQNNQTTKEPPCKTKMKCFNLFWNHTTRNVSTNTWPLREFVFFVGLFLFICCFFSFYFFGLTNKMGAFCTQALSCLKTWVLPVLVMEQKC